MKLVTAVVVALALGGCVVTRAPRPDERPRWRITGYQNFDHGCAWAKAFVRKSGKTGVGMTVELRSRTDCAIAIARAELVLASGERVPAGIRDVAPLAGRSLVYTWLAFPFDNNAAWNRGDVDGTFELDLVTNGDRAPTWRLPAHHAM